VYLEDPVYLGDPVDPGRLGCLNLVFLEVLVNPECLGDLEHLVLKVLEFLEVPECLGDPEHLEC
jgi:hypothetical protein